MMMVVLLRIFINSWRFLRRWLYKYMMFQFMRVILRIWFTIWSRSIWRKRISNLNSFWWKWSSVAKMILRYRTLKWVAPSLWSFRPNQAWPMVIDHWEDAPHFTLWHPLDFRPRRLEHIEFTCSHNHNEVYVVWLIHHLFDQALLDARLDEKVV